MLLRFRTPAPAAGPSFEDEALAQADALYRTALRATRNPAEAEDLVQDTYLKAFRAAGRFEPGTNLRAWLFTILMNTLRNRRRDLGRDPVEVAGDVVDRAEVPAARAASPEDLLLRAALAPELRAALDQLPEAFREAVWLRDVEEFTYAEIAAMLAVPLGTVMSRISRGRRQLFERLTEGQARLQPVEAGRG
jgi:RNA polymerase sigma-70 factor (ECF subfamily)